MKQSAKHAGLPIGISSHDLPGMSLMRCRLGLRNSSGDEAPSMRLQAFIWDPPCVEIA